MSLSSQLVINKFNIYVLFKDKAKHRMLQEVSKKCIALHHEQRRAAKRIKPAMHNGADEYAN